MKKIALVFAALICVATVLLVSCSTPVGLTSWKNPQGTQQVSRIVVMALFDKLTYTQPFEEQCVTYFNSQNLNSIKSLEFLTPFRQYTKAQLQQKFDSVGADGLLLISYKGTDVSVDLYSGYYGGYRGRWGGIGGGWTTTSTVNLRATLYDTKNDVVLWTGDLTLTDPGDVSASSLRIAQTIFADWLKYGLPKNPPPPAKK
jgi:hypothetical protein